MRQTEQLVAEASDKRAASDVPADEEYPESYSRLVEELEKFFSQNISIKSTRSGKGRIVIEFNDQNDIERFLSRFESINH